MRAFLTLAIAVSIIFTLTQIGASAVKSADKNASEQKSPTARDAHKQKIRLIQQDNMKTLKSHTGYFVSGGTPVRRIEGLVEDASHILLGTVSSVKEVGEGILTVSDTEYNVSVQHAVIKISAVLKGPALQTGATTQVEFYRPFSGPPWAQLQTGQYGIFFLADDGGPIDLFFPLLPIAQNVLLVENKPSPIETVEQYLLLSMKSGVTSDTLASCIEGALDLNLQKATDYLVPLTNESDTKIVGYALWGLLRFQDARAFPAATGFILNPPESARTQALMLIYAVRDLTDPTLAQAIVPLLFSKDAAYRRQALSALRHMKDPQNISLLAEALSDDDLENRYIAIMGLAETTHMENAEWASSWPKFQENPEYYVDKWRNWWEQEK
jgi:hypothetical protein